MGRVEPFTFVEGVKDTANNGGFDDYVDILSAKVADVDIQFSSRLRAQYPEMIVTTVPGGNVNLIYFADLGYAHYEADTEHDTLSRWRGFVPPDVKRGGEGHLGEMISYAKYKYKFGDEFFLLYYVKFSYTIIQYILKEPRGDSETPNTHSSETDKLLKAAGDVLYKQVPGIFVYDRIWAKDLTLLKEVQKMTWDKVILDEKMKESLVQVSQKFFDSKNVYDNLGVPWKRGLLFHGPPGNGKTITIKALMRTLSLRDPPIPTLYIKSAPGTYYIHSVFDFARYMSPCLLVLEDVETIVTPSTRSYFFNEVDGLENNNGILTVASTNFLDQLDPGLSKRPSRFDRKYLFPLPNLHERELYAGYWRDKLKKNNVKVSFPKMLCAPMARITDGFSFAYMQEAYVSSLLEIARGDDMPRVVGFPDVDDDNEHEHDPLEHHILWRVFKEQVKILRDNMDGQHEDKPPLLPRPPPNQVPYEESPTIIPVESSVLDFPGGRGGRGAGYRNNNSSHIPASIFLGGRNDLDRDLQARQFLQRWEKYPQRNEAATEYRGLNYGLTWMTH